MVGRSKRVVFGGIQKVVKGEIAKWRERVGV